MERFEYKGHIVDVFTAIKNGLWTWAFTVNEEIAEANKAAGFDNSPSAANAAKNEARRRIDEKS